MEEDPALCIDRSHTCNRYSDVICGRALFTCLESGRIPSDSIQL